MLADVPHSVSHVVPASWGLPSGLTPGFARRLQHTPRRVSGEGIHTEVTRAPSVADEEVTFV